MTFCVSHWPDPINPDTDYTTTHESLSAALDSIDPTITVEWDRARCDLPEGKVYMRVLGAPLYAIQVWVEMSSSSPIKCTWSDGRWSVERPFGHNMWKSSSEK